jgi:putative DNA primase/helicase
MKIPPRQMFLDPVIASQSLNMLFGFRGVGKTHVALGIAIAVAGGTGFLRWKAPAPRRVLYIDGELPAALLQQWMAEAALGAAEIASQNLRLITPDLQDAGIPDLATPLGQAAIAKSCDAADLIILDNLSALIHSGRENDSESWTPMQTWALDLRRRGKSILFLHHAGRSGQNQRGTSKREDLLDTIIALKRPNSYSQTEGLRAEVHFDKARGFFGKDADPFEISLTNGKESAPAWTQKEITDTLFSQAVELFKTEASLQEVMDELKIKRSKAYELLKRYRQSTKSTESTESTEE